MQLQQHFIIIIIIINVIYMAQIRRMQQINRSKQC